ncbi:ankyrin [Neocallimastix sp. 'constans']
MFSIENKRKLLKKKIYKYLSNDKSNFEDIANYIRRNRFILSRINNKTFDILTFTIENIKYQNKSTRRLIEFIYDEFQYENINYTIVLKNITKTPLFSAIVRNNLNIANYLISLNAKIYYINNKHLNIIEYINKYYLEKKVNGRIINFIFDKINQIENNENEKDIKKEICRNIKRSLFKSVPTYIENKKIDFLKSIFHCYSKNDNTKFNRYEYITDLLNAYKNKIPLTNNQIFQCLNKVKYHFKICQDWYKKVIVTLDEDTIKKKKLTFTKTVNYEVLKFLLLYEIDKNEAILKRINRNLIYEAIIQDYRYNLNLDKNLNIFKEFLEIDLNNNHYETFENNLKLLKYSNKYFLITIIMNTIKKKKAFLNEIKFYEVIICYIKKNNLKGIEEILKWIVFFEEVVLSESNVNDILIKLIEYFYKDEKNENLKSFDRILNILFENKIFNPNIDFENIIKHSLPKEIIKNIKFEKILLELIKNVDITYDIFHLLWNLIFHTQNIDLEQFKFEEIIISATNNYIIGKQIIQDLTKEDKCIIDLTDENNINEYELTNKNNSMNNFNCINDSFKNIKSNNENKLNNKRKKTKTNTNYGNISLNDTSKNNKYKYLSKEVSINKFNKETKENLNVLFIKSIKDKEVDLLENLLKNDKLKTIEINSNKIENEFPLVLAFNNCISGNNKGIYDKMYNDLNYYNFKEKEIRIFKILLEYGADLNIKLNNGNSILEESLKRNFHLITKVIFDFLIKENEKKEREKEITCYMKKSDITKERYKYNKYIRKDGQVYRNNNKKVFENNKYIIYNNYQMESIDYQNKNKKFQKYYNYKSDRIMIHSNKRYRESSEEIYDRKNKKFKSSKIINNKTLKYIKNKFTALVSDYLFQKNFDIKEWINHKNVNREDNYDYTIIYYSLLKEDRETIKYLINMGSNNMISTSIFKLQTIMHIAIFLGLKDISLDIIEKIQNINTVINHEEDNTGLFKSIMLNDHFSLHDKKKLINALCLRLEINKFNIWRNPLVIVMNMKSENNAYKLAYFLLKKINLKIDNCFKDLYKNSLVFAIEYNLYNFVEFLLEKKFKNNYENIYQAMKPAIVKAIELKNIKILELLLKKFRGNINWYNSCGESPIKLAVDSNDLNMVKLLVERKSNIENKIIYGRKYSILHYSLIKNDSNEDIIKYFVGVNAKMNIENKNEFEKLFGRLERKGKISLLKCFVNYKEKYFMENFLKYILTFNRRDILKILFENNFNPEQKIENRTLWKFARTLNNSKLYLYLKRKRKEINIMNGKKLELRRKKRRY